MRLLNWNLEWRTTRSAQAGTIRAVLERDDLDVVCLTETTTDWLKPHGEWIEAEGDYGYGAQERRRKVALWARDGFTSVTNVSPEGMPPGRFVSGVTKSGVLVVGVCISWKDAHVSTGRRDRKPWEEHVAYLAALGRHLAGVREREGAGGAGGGAGEETAGRRPALQPAGLQRYVRDAALGRYLAAVRVRDGAEVAGGGAGEETAGRRPAVQPAGRQRYVRDAEIGPDAASSRVLRICVVGDFNQSIPRSRAPLRVHEAMMRAFEGFSILTAGIAVQGRTPLIDQVAVRGGGRLESFEQLPIVSDHLGWVAEVEVG